MNDLKNIQYHDKNIILPRSKSLRREVNQGASGVDKNVFFFVILIVSFLFSYLYFSNFYFI